MDGLETLTQLQVTVRNAVDCPLCGALPGAYCAGRSTPGRRGANHPQRARLFRDVKPRIEEVAGPSSCQVCLRDCPDVVCTSCAT